MTRAFVFPGQGSQAVGMGKELADAFSAARHVFEEVDETLKQNLTKVKFMSAEPAVADNDINMFIQLYPRSVSIVFQNESQRFVFSEKSLLGYNVTTSFGPISQYSLQKAQGSALKIIYFELYPHHGENLTFIFDIYI